MKQFNIRQNILLKNVLGIKYFARFKPLLNELKIDQIEQLYFKHKIYGFKQLHNNKLTYDLFSYLTRYYDNCENIERCSYISQYNELKNFTGSSMNSPRTILELLNNRFMCNDIDIRASMRKILLEFDVKDGYL